MQHTAHELCSGGLTASHGYNRLVQHAHRALCYMMRTWGAGLMRSLQPAGYALACRFACWLTRHDAHRYNAQYSARLEGWEAARVRDLAAHTEKARHAFSSAGGDALARELVEKACS